MKKLVLIAVSALAALVLVSCSSVPERITKLADQVEAKGDKYSLDDWQKAGEKMEKLLVKFEDNADSYKFSEHAQVVKAVARFSAKAIKCGAEAVLDDEDFEDFLDEASDLGDSVKGFLQGLGL